jgi:predicted Zn-dependent protease with MMP-like domain
MPSRKLLTLAENEVERILAKLPADVLAAAAECPVWYEEMEEALDTGEDVPEDVLGLFEGNNRLDPVPAEPESMPRIRLFLDNLWDFAEGDERTYRQEVRTTYLHELGHYLGWGEEQVAALGLG